MALSRSCNAAIATVSTLAVKLAAAEAFTRSGVRTGRSIVFAAFTAEESGLLGSQAFVAKPTIPLSRIAAILNLDVMNLYGRTRDVSALGLDQSSLGAVFQKAAAAEGLKVSVNHDASEGLLFPVRPLPLRPSRSAGNVNREWGVVRGSTGGLRRDEEE